MHINKYSCFLLAMMLIINIDASAQIDVSPQWTNTFDIRTQDFTYDLCGHADGGVMVCGTSAWHDVESSSAIILLSLDEDGTYHSEWPQGWHHIYEDQDINVGMGICQSNDETYIVTGRTGSNTGSNMHLFFLEVNRWGAKLNSFLNFTDSAGYDVIRTNDGGFLAVGSLWPYSYSKFFVIKVDQNLEYEWSWSTWGISENDSKETGMCACELPDGRILVGGTSLSEGALFYLLDSDGTLIGGNCQGMPIAEAVRSILYLCPDGFSYRVAMLFSYTSGVQPGASNEAFIREYDVTPENTVEFYNGSGYHEISMANTETFRAHSLGKCSGRFIVVGMAQWLTGRSGTFILVLDNQFEVVQEYSYTHRFINCFSTWEKMSAHTAEIDNSVYFDCYFAASAHYSDGFGGYDHQWKAVVGHRTLLGSIKSQYDEESTLINGLNSTQLQQDELLIRGNPLSSSYNISYHSQSDEIVIFTFFDITGRIVRIYEVEPDNSGLIQLEFNHSIGSGRSLPNGVYYCLVEQDGIKYSASMVITR